jgi:hydroxysqualene dehydroxylase
MFEAARALGGRARAVEINGRVLDNGQHLLLGAYSETLRLLRLVGLDPERVLLRLPLQMRHPEATGMDFVAPRLPAPWHMVLALLRARGLDRQDKLALARFASTARWMDWRMDNDCSVTELLDRFDQTDTLIRLMWRPLCIAALNTPPERASAQVFLNVLRDSLGARRAASDMLIPRVDLSTLFPRHAASHIEQHGGSVLFGNAVRHLRQAGARWEIESVEAHEFDAVVLAVPPHRAATLLDGVCTVNGLAGLSYEPITTCYLQYEAGLRLPQPFFALVDDPACANWGQFVFDRGQLDHGNAGLLAVVVSASGEALQLGHATLVQALAAQIARDLRMAELRQPLWSKVISEKQATFSCTPGLLRPGNDIGCAGLVLAGDYTAGDYPATLEAAVRSGVQAARLLLHG